MNRKRQTPFDERARDMVIVVLDGNDVHEIYSLVTKLVPHVGAFMLSPRLYNVMIAELATADETNASFKLGKIRSIFAMLGKKLLNWECRDISEVIDVVKGGAKHAVVGRIITTARDPADAADNLVSEIATVLEQQQVA